MGRIIRINIYKIILVNILKIKCQRYSYIRFSIKLPINRYKLFYKSHFNNESLSFLEKIKMPKFIFYHRKL